MQEGNIGGNMQKAYGPAYNPLARLYHALTQTVPGRLATTAGVGLVTILLGGCASTQETQDISAQVKEPSIARRVGTYFKDRGLDLLDPFTVEITAFNDQLAIGASLKATDALHLAIGACSGGVPAGMDGRNFNLCRERVMYMGIPFPQLLYVLSKTTPAFPYSKSEMPKNFWLITHMEYRRRGFKKDSVPMVEGEMDFSYLIAFLGGSYASVESPDDSKIPSIKQLLLPEKRKRNPIRSLDMEIAGSAGMFTFLFGARVGFSPGEFVDAALGTLSFGYIDIAKDDTRYRKSRVQGQEHEQKPKPDKPLTNVGMARAKSLKEARTSKGPSKRPNTRQLDKGKLARQSSGRR